MNKKEANKIQIRILFEQLVDGVLFEIKTETLKDWSISIKEISATEKKYKSDLIDYTIEQFEQELKNEKIADDKVILFKDSDCKAVDLIFSKEYSNLIFSKLNNAKAK